MTNPTSSSRHRTTSSSGAISRLAEVAPERVRGWVERFTASHGPVTTTAEADAVVLEADDGTRAVMTVPWPPLVLEASDHGSSPDAGVLPALVAHAALPRITAVLLVRRGGYSAGVALDGKLLDHSGGTRYVQGRTAAGGWSQQRYAHRRANQAHALVGAAAFAASQVLERSTRTPQVLVVGGDRTLLDDVLAQPALAALAGLPRSPLLDVLDPRHAVLVEAARRARCVRVLVTDHHPARARGAR